MNKVFNRMSLSIINKCNQNCPWCFEGSWKNQPLEMMEISLIHKLLRWKNWDNGEIPMLFLLGGEPTLHPQLLDIIHIVKEFNPQIRIALLTNLTCETKLLKEIVDLGVILFINIDQYDPGNNVKNHQIIKENFVFLNQIDRPDFSYNISATVSHPDKSFDFAYEIIRNGKEKIFNFRLAPSCIGYGFDNTFQTVANDAYYQKIYTIIQECRNIHHNLHFSSECATNGCMLSNELYYKLNDCGYAVRFQCGEPEPNADILPDCSTHWCFAFRNIPEMSIENVFQYDNYDAMIEALMHKYNQYNSLYKSGSHCQQCSHVLCKGKCIALRYYEALNKKDIIL